jgi:antitoxin ParD1/3/4
MPDTEKLSIELPTSVARIIREKVDSGEYASQSEVVSDGVLQLNGSAIELADDWLRKEAVPALEALEAEPSRGLTPEQVLAHLHERHNALRKAG